MDTRMTRTWAEVSLGALRHNAAELQRALPDGCGLLGVVKAVSYLVFGSCEKLGYFAAYSFGIGVQRS